MDCEQIIKYVCHKTSILETADAVKIVRKNQFASHSALVRLAEFKFSKACVKRYYQSETGSDDNFNFNTLSDLMTIGETLKKKQEENDKLKQREDEEKFPKEKHYPLLEALQKQVNTHNYSNLIKLFARYIRITSGKKVYNFLRGVIPLPAISTVDKYHGKLEPVVEGVLQVSVISFLIVY